MSIRHILLALLICFIWGLNFTASKYSVSYFPTFFFLATRLILVALVLLPFIKKPNMPFVKLYKVATMLTVVHFGFMFASLENGLDASVASIVDQTRVPLAVFFGWLLLKEDLSRKVIFGIAVALTGTIVIVGTPNVVNNYLAFFMLIGASVAWAFYNIQIKNLPTMDAISFIGWSAIIGAPQLMVISFIFEGNNIPLLLNAPLMPILSMFYVVVGSSIVAHGAWYYLLRLYPVNQIVPYTLLIPFFAVLMGAVLMNEVITVQVILGGILTILGVAIVVFKKANSIAGGDET